MLKVNRSDRSLESLESCRLTDAGMTERGDVQSMIRNSPEAFFAEMGENLLLIGEEIRPSDVVDDRIDLLAIDERGSAVIIEIKRDYDKLQLLQALSYAAMISGWDPSRFLETRGRFFSSSESDACDEIERFLAEDIAELNLDQRVVLLAEEFDYSVLATAAWLTDQYEMDIRCYRLTLSRDSEQEYLGCTCVYPPPELAKAAIRRGRRVLVTEGPWRDWDTALEDLQNDAVSTFLRDKVSAGQECDLRQRSVMFRFAGKRRLFVGARRKFAYVWQSGRFDQDREYWTTLLGSETRAEPVEKGRSLRFYLSTSEQFVAFQKAVDHELTQREFKDTPGDSESNPI